MPTQTPQPAVFPPAPAEAAPPLRVALLGNPNTGKTTLFNRLSGLRHKTGNFPGTTLEARVGRIRIAGACLSAPSRPAAQPRETPLCPATERHLPSGFACQCEARDAAPPAESPAEGEADLIDLPGIYSLELDQLESEICRAVLDGRTAPRGQPVAEPSALCIVADATNLPRNLVMVGEALRRRLPTVIALNMIDLARRRGIHIDPATLERELGCPVICTSARTGEGLAELVLALGRARIPSQTPPGDDAGTRRWAEALYAQAAGGEESLDADTFTDRLDRLFTHPLLGTLAFAAIMAGLFWALFTLAKYPMDWIDGAFAALSASIEAGLPEGAIRDLLSQGIIGGVGATLIFLPQICLLFFLISILEDTGYLARAAFVMDRLLRPFGLPGHAFMPLLSSHACALPGIMATRAIPDRRERLATILVAPFMTCSARLPVYILLTTLLFQDRPALAAVAFVGCYALGIAAGILSALLARRTILRGRSRPMALELPTYKIPSLRTALLTTLDRAAVFIRNAGTNILAIVMILWWLGSFPHVAPPAAATELRQQAAALVDSGRQHPGTPQDHRHPGHPDASNGFSTASGPSERPSPADLLDEADRLERAHAKSSSFAGMLGRAIQPALAPLGFDWQLSVGILSSFAAREVFVSTMAVITTGQEGDDDSILRQIGQARRDDGSPIFTRAVCWSLLVYYVLAMQCLPTLAVTAREAGGGKWALLQLLWMTALAYLAAALTFQLAS
jgi:ferrous iron transport protein B